MELVITLLALLIATYVNLYTPHKEAEVDRMRRAAAQAKSESGTVRNLTLSERHMLSVAITRRIWAATYTSLANVVSDIEATTRPSAIPYMKAFSSVSARALNRGPLRVGLHSSRFVRRLGPNPMLARDLEAQGYVYETVEGLKSRVLSVKDLGKTWYVKEDKSFYYLWALFDRPVYRDYLMRPSSDYVHLEDYADVEEESQASRS